MEKDPLPRSLRWLLAGPHRIFAEGIRSLPLGAHNKQASKSVSTIELAVFLYLNLRSDLSSFLPYYGRESLCPAHTQGDGITEGCEYQDAGITEGILEVVYHPKNRTKACTSFNTHLDYTSQSLFPVAARVVLIKCRQELLLISANPPSHLSTTSAFQVLTSAYLPTLIPPPT